MFADDTVSEHFKPPAGFNPQQPAFQAEGQGPEKSGSTLIG